MAVALDFFQIYYDDSQLPELYDFATPYRNEKLTDYFENSVIAELVPRSEANLISVCSWRLRKKRGEGPSMLQLRNNTGLTTEKILSNDFDVAILTPRSPTHRPLAMAANWHGVAWIQAFNKMLPFFSDVGIRIRGELKHTIYENHFIARSEIYKDYVSTLLQPAINYMADDPVFAVDAGYSKRKTAQELKEVVAKLGHAWTIAPFILERLFSIYINDRNFKIVKL